MSFLSELGSIAREFLDVKDEIVQTVMAPVQDLTTAASDVKSDMSSSLGQVVQDLTEAKEGLLEDVTAIKDSALDQAKGVVEDIAKS